MNSPLLFLVLAIALSATSDRTSGLPFAESQESTSLRGTSRFPALQPPRVVLTCDKYPKVCSFKGSQWPDCCAKRCVNLMKDWLNCGTCGKKCKYFEMCCNGECVNVMSNKNHCGGCDRKCKKRDTCVYGMCNYAYGRNY